MNELDLLLKELDAVGSARASTVHALGSPGDQPAPFGGKPKDVVTLTKTVEKRGAGIKELDSLVRDLTDLKGLVSSSNEALAGPGAEMHPSPLPPNRPPQQSPPSRHLPVPAQVNDSVRRPSEVAGQLERLMGDLSLEAAGGDDGESISSDRTDGSLDALGGPSADITNHSEGDRAEPQERSPEHSRSTTAPSYDAPPTPFSQPPSSHAQLSDSAQGSLPQPDFQPGSGPTSNFVSNTVSKFCVVCHKPLSGPVVNAMGRTYHPEHFTCFSCNRQLGHGRFFEKAGEAYCDSCWQMNLPKCAYCSGRIMERCITALGQHWHPHHFFCAQCGKLFPPGAGFLEKDGMAYCEEDYFNLFAMRCGGCGKGIIGEFVSACGKEWHMGCFVCADCKQPFPTGTFYEQHGQPYCATHHALRRAHQMG
ncbi:uncharacterized protein SPPG_03527 [Spizellomyces punctatus DAOM BR117]|uniref:LIM zinc-binding domain-containing protein n=1 Tax=Spizellomyces punctatus (strain DAOM BR117) TaxID=645134 RepID=A0A0L0HLP9_SPIPD|nr:uncharacterized protein SPPG_03527 [Spizellomyces punctatus DAOM BR117]KND01734.1 hypothetical protein SPPG_03527 [Spizellomyces punctatus DAOM BR117]|eukprot:XP_016609773.1 hypothetical protein SPPG_03527 [Spizellomyces punctatus DAOM BR117]